MPFAQKVIYDPSLQRSFHSHQIVTITFYFPVHLSFVSSSIAVLFYGLGMCYDSELTRRSTDSK